MKILYGILLVLALQSGELLADKPIVISESVMDRLSVSITTVHQRLVKDMPDTVKQDVLSAREPVGIYEIPERSQQWIHDNVSMLTDVGVVECFKALQKELAVSGDKMHGEDYSSILEKAFFAKMHKVRFDLREEVEGIVVYWREHSTPDVGFSPDGRGRIDWLWQLEVDDRPEGVLHVGIDDKKRTFICYEYDVGLYFPEGEVLERIYREIVQEPDVAGEFVGKGRLRKK